jgi:DNA polymerase-3 subunit delta'
VSFADLKMQKTVVDPLRRSLQRGRLAHAYLFTGSRHECRDMETVARSLAKALNCLQREHDFCDRCDSCTRIERGAHPDMYWVRPESKSRRITVEQIGEFEQAVNLRANMARVKLGVIVDADCMGEEAGNGFLKTLEEPPAQTIMLLLSAEPQRLLPTILSRCLKIPFLATRPVAETGAPYRAKLLPLLLKFSARGQDRIVGAYQLHADITGLLREIQDSTRKQLEAEANLDRYEELDPKVRDKLDAQLQARVEGEYRANRERLLEELYSWFGDVLLCVENADEKFLVHRDQAGAARRAAAGLTYAQAAENLDAVEQIRDSLARNIPEPLALEVGLLKLAQ